MRSIVLAPLIFALGLPAQAGNQKNLRFPTLEEAKILMDARAWYGECEKKKDKKSRQECADKKREEKLRRWWETEVLCNKFKDPDGCNYFETFEASKQKSNRLLNQIRNQCNSAKDYRDCISDTKRREKTKLEINKNKEKLVLIHKCKDKILCQFPGDGDLYIDKNSFRVTSDNVTIHNQREYSYPDDIDGTKSKNQKFGVFGKIQTIGIDCKNKTKTSIIFGKEKLLISKDATKEELKAYSSIPINDRIFELSCKDRKHPSIKKTANQIIYGNMDKLDKIFLDLQVNPNSKTRTNTKKSIFHEECKNSNDYFGCIKYKENK